MKAIGFVGLGVMGGPMAGHLVRAGHPVTVWNRTPGKATSLEQAGATVAADLADLAAKCHTVFLCVGRSEDVEECLRAMMPSAAPGTLFVDHSTIAPPAALALARQANEQGHRFVDAPITGGSMGAINGTLTIFCGGEEADVEAAMPYLQAYAKRAERVGGSGSGQMMKMANQIAVGGALVALCECLAFAHKAGLDLAQTRELVGGGAAGSWAFENYGPKILNQDWSPGFSIDNQLKDFGYVQEAAREIDAPVPATTVVQSMLEELRQEGHGGWTTAALYDLMCRMGYRGDGPAS